MSGAAATSWICDSSERLIDANELSSILKHPVETASRLRGVAGLRIKAAPGATPKLSTVQHAGLRRRLLAGALAQDFSTDLWTCPRVVQLIERVYGVHYHVDHIPYVMRSLGFSV
ncbi:MAG: winged helix-turn-helix domain-containing protein, partial [Deltaproteobacteria bacterium]